jgi:predicted HD phosphohydrolase
VARARSVLPGCPAGSIDGTTLEADMAQVSFTRMADGTQSDYELLRRLEREHCEGLPDRLIRAVDALTDSLGGYQVTRYEHSLQTASRALRDGRDEEYVVMALVHDIGDDLAPHSHSEMIGAVLRPFVRPEVHWIAKHHGVFQLYYYGHHVGADRNARDRYRDSPWFDACAEFCELYDQVSFDPKYDSLPMDAFRPLLDSVFSAPRYLGADDLI